MIKDQKKILLLSALFFCFITKAQVYDTISFPHSYTHESHITLLDGRVFKGPLVDTKDSTIIISDQNRGDSIFEITAREIEMIQVFRSNFERTTTNKLIVFSVGATTFFSTLSYLGDRKEDLKFKNSEWLMSGIATLVAMPLAALISNAVYHAPREKYLILGDPLNFKKIYPELKAYSYWTYLSSKENR